MKLLGISGSLRKESRNSALVREAARLFAPESFTFADLDLPLYNGDVMDRDGVPAAVARLHEQIRAADAVVIATPEYNKNLPGVLKNALDWVSMVRPGAWPRKPVAIMSAAAGRAGGERAQFSLRHCLTPFNPRILQAPEVMVADADNAFDAEGHLTDELALRLLTRQMAALRDEVALQRLAAEQAGQRG